MTKSKKSFLMRSKIASAEYTSTKMWMVNLKTSTANLTFHQWRTLDKMEQLWARSREQQTATMKKHGLSQPLDTTQIKHIMSNRWKQLSLRLWKTTLIHKESRLLRDRKTTWTKKSPTAVFIMWIQMQNHKSAALAISFDFD